MVTSTFKQAVIADSKVNMRNLFLCFVFALALQGCAPKFDCSDDIKSEVTSPAGKVIATYYERDCGATTDTATRINLRPAFSKFNADEGLVFVSEGRFQVKLIWDSDRSLRVECPNCKPRDIFKQEKSWAGVSVSYLTFDPTKNNENAIPDK